MMTADFFRSGVATLVRGQAIVYHEGLLMRDRQGDPELAALGDAAWSLHLDGVVSLVQARTVPGSCAYLAVKR